MFGNRLLYIVFLAVFLFIMLVGLFSGVSVSASLFRAFFAGVFFAVLTWGVSILVKQYVISELIAPPVLEIDENVGTNFDFTVAETLDEAVTSDPNITSNQVMTSNAGQGEPEFAPLGAKQIDPQVEKIISNDPKRMADIIKKMGFEN